MKQFFTKNFHLINIPPLFYITLSFVVGIIWHSAFILFLTLCLLLALYALRAYFRKTSIPQHLLLCSLFAIYGAWLYEKEIIDYNNFYTCVENKKCIVHGTIIDVYDVIVHYKKSTVIAIAVDTIATKDTILQSNKTLLFYTKSNKNMSVGDTVTF